MVSSGKGYKITVYLKAGQNSKATAREQPHEAFVNMQDDEASLHAFIDRWGAVVSESPGFGKYDGPNLDLRDHLREAWRGNETKLRFIEDSVGRYMRSKWMFNRGHIEIVADDLWSTICVLFLRDRAAHKTGICTNPACHSPYFIRKRKTQKYCEAGPCTAEAQRRHKLDWWNRVGKIRAKKQAQKGRKTAS